MEPITMIDAVEIEISPSFKYRAKGKPHWYFDPDSARYDGCTHRPCQKCGAPAQRHYTHCSGCRSLADNEAHAKREHREWDGKSMVYSHRLDKWYIDPYEAYEDMEDGESWESYRVVMGELKAAPSVDLDGHFDDYQNEDGELPFDPRDPGVEKALNALNDAIAAAYQGQYEASNIAVNEPCKTPTTGDGTPEQEQLHA